MPNNLNTVIGLVLSLLPMVGCANNQIAAETTQNGWENYKFGMSPDQVRAFPGASWLPIFTTSSGEKISLLTSRTPFNRYGIDFGQTRLTFSADLKLTGIALTYAVFGKSPDDCEKQLQTLLPILEHRYGVFVPALAENDVHIGLGSPIVWRDVPGSKSRYSYDTIPSFGAIGTISSAEAKHMIGAGYVDVRMIAGNGQRENCGLTVSFQEK